jgi:glucosamine--fructose-6-phosphate aminotransferase (isomerizing)
MTTKLELEIAEQPQCVATLLSSGREAIAEAAAKIRERGPKHVVIAARGTSDNAARYAQYLFGVRQGWVTALAAPSLHTLYGAVPDMSQALVIGISQSGASPDVVSVLESARKQGGLTLAITNNTESSLAHAAELVVDQGAGVEQSVAATKTYTTQLAALALLSSELSADRGGHEELAMVPEAMADTITMSGHLAAEARAFLDVPHYFLVGRGFNYSTAFEIALKVKETNYVIAEPYSPADLLHGPVAVVGQDFPVMLVAPKGRTSKTMAEAIEKLAERGARQLVVSDDAAVLDGAAVRMPIAGGVPEWLSPLCTVIPGQIWARVLAEARGLDPDRPRGLSKVTLTH